RREIVRKPVVDGDVDRVVAVAHAHVDGGIEPARGRRRHEMRVPVRGSRVQGTGRDAASCWLPVEGGAATRPGTVRQAQEEWHVAGHTLLIGYEVPNQPVVSIGFPDGR